MFRAPGFSSFNIFNATPNLVTDLQAKSDGETIKSVNCLPTLAKHRRVTTLEFDFTSAEENPTTALQQLHHLGTLLINSGKAYSACMAGEDISHKPATENEIGMNKTLISYYNSLPNIQDGMLVAHGHPKTFAQSVQKILHALFVIRVALDHLSPQKIYQLYESFMAQNEKCSLSASLTSFADASGFVGTYAAEQVLLRYIYNNALLFSFINASKSNAVIKKESKNSQLICIGGAPRREKINSLFKMDFTAISQQKLETPLNRISMHKE